MNTKNLISLYFSIAFLFLLGISSINYKIDLTENKRFTLKNETVSKIRQIDNKINIDVFLSGDLPSSYRKLYNEIKELLNSFNSINKKLNINFINPFGDDLSTQNVISKMSSYGMSPDYILDTNKQSIDQKIVFPWAILNDNKNSILIPLTKSNRGESQEQIIINSIEKLEYKIIDGLDRLTNKKKLKLAFITSHETSPNIKISDWINDLQKYYKVVAFDLKRYKSNPKETFKNLTTFPVIIVSNPKKPFSKEEKFILDQYQINGGNILWLIDTVKIDLELLFKNDGKVLGVKNNLNLDDYFFNYELRINPILTKDIYCAPIIIANGKGNETKYLPFPWVYYPLAKPNKKNIVSSGVEDLLFRFSSPIDTLPGSSNKKILVSSSNYNQYQSIPSMIDLNSAISPINPNKYDLKSKPLIVLSEGNFNSLFKNRIPPIPELNFKNNGKSKFILISDGQFAENQTEGNKPLELGYDKWTNNFYSNKDFLMNSVHYLIDNYKFLKIKSKKVRINLLDIIKVKNRSKFESIIFLILPLIFLIFLKLIIIKSRNSNS